MFLDTFCLPKLLTSSLQTAHADLPKLLGLSARIFSVRLSNPLTMSLKTAQAELQFASLGAPGQRRVIRCFRVARNLLTIRSRGLLQKL